MPPKESEAPKMSGALPGNSGSQSVIKSDGDSSGGQGKPETIDADPSTEVPPRERQRRQSMFAATSALHEITGRPTIARPEDIHGYKGTFDPNARILVQPIGKSTSFKISKSPAKRTMETAQRPPQDEILHHEAAVLPGLKSETSEAKGLFSESIVEPLFAVGDLSDEDSKDGDERKSSLDMLTRHWPSPLHPMHSLTSIPLPGSSMESLALVTALQAKEQEQREQQNYRQKGKQKEVQNQLQQPSKTQTGQGIAAEEIEKKKDIISDTDDECGSWGTTKKSTKVAEVTERPEAQQTALPPVVPQTEQPDPYKPQRQQSDQQQQQQQQQRRRRRIPIKFHYKSYQPALDRASMALTHIKNGKIHKDSRHNYVKITYLDYIKSSAPEFFDIEGIDDHSIFQPLSVIPANVQRRLIIVEDLSKNTIDYLGGLFDISPEFFEEHLTNSGYGGAFYNDPLASSWKTSGMEKPYVSVKWYRPALRLNVFPFSHKDLEDLLDPSLPGVANPWSRSMNLRIFKTATNIFRSEWELWTDPKTTTSMERACAWEERASVWSKKLPDKDCQIVILLLDPLPTLVEQEERDVMVTALPPRDSVDSNSGEDEESTEQSREIVDNNKDEEAILNAGLLRKRYAAEKSTWHQMLRYIIFSKKERELLLKIQHLPEVFEAKAFKRIGRHTLIEQSALRSPLKHSYDELFQLDDAMEELGVQLSETKSTKSEFCRWLEVNGNLGAVMPLLQIIRRDSVELLRILDQALDIINEEILDDLKMEDRLSLWRKLIARAELEIPELRRSITTFLSFLQVLDPSIPTVKPTSPSAIGPYATVEGVNIKEVENLFKKFDDMDKRLRLASESLMKNMALLDSQRSISEARAVTKLTELAFFFIPLTFAASLFGMQIDLLENRAPFSAFLLIATAFITLAYIVRLLIRSLWLRDLVGAFKKSIRRYADENHLPIQRGSVPTGVFLQWAWTQLIKMLRKILTAIWALMTTTLPKIITSFWSITGFVIKLTLLISLFATAPIAILWTRNMNHGIQAVLTFIILGPIIGIIGVPYYRATEREVRSALPSFIRKNFRHYVLGNPWLLNLLVWALFISTAVVPLAIIWSRPVASGLKAAVTVVIILIVVISNISYSIYRLYRVANAQLWGDEDDSSISIVDE